MLSCNDAVNPKTDFNKVYSLNCVISGDTTFQMATVSGSYDLESFDPNSNEVDPFIGGAKLTIFYNGMSYTFRDTMIARPAGAKYNTPMHLYCLNNFKPESNSQISIEAVMPDGKALKSKSTTYYLAADLIDFNIAVFPFPVTGYGSKLILKWDKMERRNKIEDIYFNPELVIKYHKIENGTRVDYEKRVPRFYSDGPVDQYLTDIWLQKDIRQAEFDTLAIRRTIEELSLGDPYKENYIIDKAVFRLIAIDKNLAIYYSSQKTYNEEFSVRVTQPNFTNIEGGFGLFSTICSAHFDIPIRASYIKSWGYRTN